MKLSQLSCEGWYGDTSHHMDGETQNSGFMERNQLFRKNFSTELEYRPEGATFFGRLLLDLASASCGLPPGCKIKIELDRTSDEFFLITQKTDNEKYKVKILNICLLVPVAQLSQTVYNQISTLHTKQDVAIHYRRLEIRPFSLNRNSEEFNSNNLFVEEIPCRIVICFVETPTKNGKYHSNPFNLLRSWRVKKEAIQVDQAISHHEQLLEARIKQLESTLNSFQTIFDPTIRGKGRGKKSSATKTPTTPAPSPSSSFSRPQRNKPASVASDLWTEDGDDEEETFYLKNLELTLNGTLIDQVK